MKIDRRFALICLIILITVASSKGHCAPMKDKIKTIVIVVDEMDFNTVKQLTENYGLIGLISNRTSSIYRYDGKESQYLTIATGRRDYKDTLLLGDILHKENIATGYIGQGSSSLIISDSNRMIDYKINSIIYDINWLTDETTNILKQIDVLVVEYNIDNNQRRIDLLNDYLKTFDKVHILVIATDMPKDVLVRFNNSVSLCIYKTPHKQMGLLYSDTTKREGIISNLDILPNIAGLYNIDDKGFLGNKIKWIESDVNTNNLKELYNKAVNLNFIKYLFHFVIIVLEMYVIWRILLSNELKNRNIDNLEFIMNSIIVGVPITFIMGKFDLNLNIIIYISFVVTSTSILCAYLEKYKIDMITLFSVVTYLTILYGIFLDNNMLYNSYLGYNNILVGGRFYGLNNGVVGVFLATSVITYYHFTSKTTRKVIKYLVLISIFSLIILGVSSFYGANTGGYFVGVFLILIILMKEFYNSNESSRKKYIIVILILISGLLIVFINYYLDATNDISHAGSLITRIRYKGYDELWDIILVKIKQLAFMIIVPPWSLILISEVYFFYKLCLGRIENLELLSLRCNYKDNQLLKEIKVILAASFANLLINDTGVITFTYMNTYVIARIISLHNTKKR